MSDGGKESQLRDAVQNMHGGTLADRREYEAPVLRGPAYRTDQLSTGSSAGGDRRGAAADKVNLHRGFLRIGIGLAMLWLWFWTCAYIVRPQSSEAYARSPDMGISFTVLAPLLIAAAILVVPWIVSGFRSN